MLDYIFAQQYQAKTTKLERQICWSFAVELFHAIVQIFEVQQVPNRKFQMKPSMTIVWPQCKISVFCKFVDFFATLKFNMQQCNDSEISHSFSLTSPKEFFQTRSKQLLKKPKLCSKIVALFLWRSLTSESQMLPKHCGSNIFYFVLRICCTV